MKQFTANLGPGKTNDQTGLVAGVEFGFRKVFGRSQVLFHRFLRNNIRSFAALGNLAGNFTADLAQGALFPALESIRATSVVIAAAVVRVALEESLATVEVPTDIEGWLADRMYQPVYRPIPADRRAAVLVGS